MIRPREVVSMGISLITVYRRARALNLEKPYRFTQNEVNRILKYKPKGKANQKEKAS
jgi:hypothetical protein